MKRAIKAAMVGLGLMMLSACAPTTGPATDDLPVLAGSWRHWQPAGLQLVDAQGVESEEPAVGGSHPKAVVLALHGFNDYSNAFQDFAAYSKQRGFAVHAYDQRGFGANPDRGLWPGIDTLANDLKAAIARLRGIYGEETPLFVLGESMGGAVTIAAATGDAPIDVDGIILSAPAVWGGPHMNPFYRTTLWFASTLAPGWVLRPPAGLKIRPSDNIEMLRAFSADPMVIKGTRTGTIAGLVGLMDKALASAASLDVPTLLLIGEKDEIVPLGAMDDFESRLEVEDATAIRYPEGYHMLLRDLQRERVFADIEGWIEQLSAEKDAGPAAASSGSRDLPKG